jgi:hypothetical protein
LIAPIDPKLFVPLLTGLPILQKHFKFSLVNKAVKVKDFSALDMMPIFLFFRGYSFGKEYFVGVAYG